VVNFLRVYHGRFTLDDDKIWTMMRGFRKGAAAMSAAPPRLGKVQYQIMQVLWRHGRATARRITEELSQDQPIAHSTVQTLLRKMEAKGAVTHEIEDRTFVFVPLYQQNEVKENVL